MALSIELGLLRDWQSGFVLKDQLKVEIAK